MSINKDRFLAHCFLEWSSVTSVLAAEKLDAGFRQMMQSQRRKKGSKAY